MSKPNVFQTILSVAACKAARGLMRLRGSGGTALPGKAAMVFARNILERTSDGMEIIVVTGTNGKTTTCRMLEHALTSSGKECLANKSGANLLSGVTAEITCNATWTGKPKTHYAVIECDEGALHQVVPLIHPKVIVVTNLFRDQLDRYGEITHTRDAIRKGIKLVPDAKIVLNADDSLVASLAEDIPNAVIWYGCNVPLGEQKDAEISDAKYCLHCGTAYTYRWHTYAHLGAFECPKCGYRRQDPDAAVTKVTKSGADGTGFVLGLLDKKTGELKEHDVFVGLPAPYNMYNALAAITGGLCFGLSLSEIVPSLADVHSSFGRMETFDLGGKRVQMILVKNPTGCNQAMGYVKSIDEDFNLVFALNDRTADGHDISWIWDADHEMIADDPHVKQIYVTGDRAEDMQLRLKYADFDTKKITLVKDQTELLSKIKESTLPVFMLPNYTSMFSLRKLLSDATGGEDFWKG
ncbi:MAG: MurT ligase domain-containing protein [Lachnospiraceae bacterium]|jgi:UDP-N-acetylmuramyl tripeptide synthase